MHIVCTGGASNVFSNVQHYRHAHCYLTCSGDGNCYKYYCFVDMQAIYRRAISVDPISAYSPICGSGPSLTMDSPSRGKRAQGGRTFTSICNFT